MRSCLVGSILLTCSLIFVFSFAAADQSTSTQNKTIDFLNPQNILDTFKNNITIPVPQIKQLGDPKKALEEVTPKLKEINEGVKKEAGVDLSKFLGWLAKMLKIMLQTIINFLEVISNALKS